MNADTDPITPTQLDLLAQLERSRVQFILIGGVASRVHGGTVETANVDVLVRREASNLDRLATALAQLDAYLAPPGREPVDKLRPYSEPVPDHIWRTHWQTNHGRLNVLYGMVDATGVLQPIDHYAKRSTPHTFDRDDDKPVTVRVLDLADIIASRAWVRSMRDRQALPELRRLLRAQRAAQGLTQSRRGPSPRSLRPANEPPNETDPSNDG